MHGLLYYWKIALRADWLSARLFCHAILGDWPEQDFRDGCAELARLRREIRS